MLELYIFQHFSPFIFGIKFIKYIQKNGINFFITRHESINRVCMVLYIIGFVLH
jgi:hypothetical protein